MSKFLTVACFVLLFLVTATISYQVSSVQPNQAMASEDHRK